MKLFEDNVYGARPKPSGKLNYEVSIRTECARRKGNPAVNIYFSEDKSGQKRPCFSSSRRPPETCTRFLTLSFSGNQAALSDPSIKLGTVWNSRTKQKQDHRPIRAGGAGGS
jgi:hypothetical protein